MRIKRNCKICNESFLAIKHTQWFCKRKCFKKDYYQRTKVKLAELERRTPNFECNLCGNHSNINFDPIKDEQAFGLFICPFCGVPREIMVTHHLNTSFVWGNSYTKQFVIHSAISSFSTNSI